MGFGTRTLPARLRAARTIVYCQAAVVFLSAAFAVEAQIIAGSNSGFGLSGLLVNVKLSGTGVTVILLADIAVAGALVIADQRAAVRRGSARYGLDAAEAVLTVYLLGFVGVTLGAWIFGPLAGAAALLLHHWPELHSYFFAADATPAALASGEPPVIASGTGSDTRVAPPL